MKFKHLLASIIGTVTLASGSCTYASALPGPHPEYLTLSVTAWVMASGLTLYTIIKATVGHKEN